MTDENRELLELLKSELAFLEQGGYGRSVKTPWKPTSVFQDSPSCLNFNDPSRPHPCNECLLMAFVPREKRGENIPCHHIPLDREGRSVDGLERWGTQQEMEEATAAWLRRTIASLEQKVARAG